MVSHFFQASNHFCGCVLHSPIFQCPFQNVDSRNLHSIPLSVSPVLYAEVKSPSFFQLTPPLFTYPRVTGALFVKTHTGSPRCFACPLWPSGKFYCISHLGKVWVSLIDNDRTFVPSLVYAVYFRDHDQFFPSVLVQTLPGCILKTKAECRLRIIFHVAEI